MTYLCFEKCENHFGRNFHSLARAIEVPTYSSTNSLGVVARA